MRIDPTTKEFMLVLAPCGYLAERSNRKRRAAEGHPTHHVHDVSLSFFQSVSIHHPEEERGWGHEMPWKRRTCLHCTPAAWGCSTIGARSRYPRRRGTPPIRPRPYPYGATCPPLGPCLDGKLWRQSLHSKCLIIL
jgi:hypothetical protein